MVAVVSVDSKLIDHLERVLAPVLDVDQGVIQRRTVVADEAVDAAEGAGGGVDVGGDDFFEEALEFAIGQADAIETFKFLSEILLQAGAVTDVSTIFVLQITKCVDEVFFELPFG